MGGIAQSVESTLPDKREVGGRVHLSPFNPKGYDFFTSHS